MKETKHIEINRHPSTRGWFILVHKLSGYQLISLKSKDKSLELAQQLEDSCDLNFSTKDVERGNYPYEAMSKIINEANNKCLEEVLAKRKSKACT